MKQCLAAHLECLNADTICLSNSCTEPRSTNCIGEEKIMNRTILCFEVCQHPAPLHTAESTATRSGATGKEYSQQLFTEVFLI